MKKSLITLTIMLAAAAMIAAFSCPALAAVTGSCVECHTMHNSQGGSDMAVNELNVKVADPYAHLTMSSCVGCHFTATSIDAPKINGGYGTTDARAGGTFLENSTGSGVPNDQCVHNVDIALPTLSEDDVIDTAAEFPGLNGSNMNAGNGSTSPQDLTCAGSNGCHGDATISGNDAGIAGFHHGSKEGYRYLQIASNQNKVTGLGSSDWELGGAKATNHNVYSSDSDGISKLCANCHPGFHGTDNTKSGSNWIRHPTDQDIPSGWSPNVTSPDLYEEHPFAFASPTGKSTTASYDATSAQVMCISCHRAHGSPYEDILRWDYDSQNAGSGFDEGCLGCHDAQR